MATWNTQRTFYRGQPSTAPVRKGERGFFGPGVYLSEQISVAQSYGPVILTLQVRGQVFQAYPGSKSELSRRPKAEQEIIAALPEKAREKVAGMKSWYRTDAAAFWEAISRSVDPAVAVRAIAGADYTGIEGIGDGHEINIFDPDDVRLAR